MGALGYVMQVPEEEKYLMKKSELITEITTLLGGRASEEIFFGDVTTGASNDIERATDIARSMVTRYGMSDKFGMMGLETIQNRYLDGRPVMTCGEATESEIDGEVMKILDACYAEALKIIEEHKEVMHKLAAHLIEKETITGDEFVEIFEEETGKKVKRRESVLDKDEKSQEDKDLEGKSLESDETLDLEAESSESEDISSDLEDKKTGSEEKSENDDNDDNNSSTFDVTV